MAYNKAQIERFDNINQMLTALKNRPANTVFKSRDLSSETGSEDFTRTKSYEEALKLIENGWEEPLEKIKKGVSNGFKSNGTLNKSRPQTGIVGYAPCVPNAILGLPNSMIMTEKTPSKVKAVTILFMMSVNCGISEKDILESGIIVLNIINDLELAGYRVKLDVEFFGASEGSDICSARVNVKDWRQPLDLKKLAFPISNPSMFRRIGFRWLETYPQLKNRGYASGYGSSSFRTNYKECLKVYNESGMLDKNEYAITVYLCREKKFNKDEIIKACGLIDVTNKGAA